MLKKYTVKSLTNILKELFPLNLAEDWDKVGIQIGSPRKVVKNVLVVLDVTKYSIDYAIKNKVDLIVTFHPFLFNDSDFEKHPKQPWKKKIHERLINSGVSIYSMHTSFDKEWKGMPLAMSRKLGLENYSKPIKGLDHGLIFNWNKTLGQLMQHFKETFDLNATLSNIEKKRTKIKKFALLPGSGSCEDIQLAFANNKIDLLVTSDIKWSDWITIDEEGLKVMEVSHVIEKVFIDHIANYLREMTKDIKILSFQPKIIIKHS
ncbi:Nif3-like dinuclear metal center hexameric protein [Mycoplasma marinum]|uniref:GTP cyclohydrolase 1 type 2 homolog n=1 Tax=Mycoplasma marinum TaxID=1937190 RepID=A0A4R0XNN6_9MOLU|nr:Nif3-like dinuclear metal center hexameric protein [Mycoplasma marinum]TCG11112.1 hypothetical protein C4B24_02860 [Mycoplasma marinum]